MNDFNSELVLYVVIMACKIFATEQDVGFVGCIKKDSTNFSSMQSKQSIFGTNSDWAVPIAFGAACNVSRVKTDAIIWSC